MFSPLGLKAMQKGIYPDNVPADLCDYYLELKTRLQDLVQQTLAFSQKEGGTRSRSRASVYVKPLSIRVKKVNEQQQKLINECKKRIEEVEHRIEQCQNYYLQRNKDGISSLPAFQKGDFCSIKDKATRRSMSLAFKALTQYGLWEAFDQLDESFLQNFTSQDLTLLKSYVKPKSKADFIKVMRMMYSIYKEDAELFFPRSTTLNL